MKDKNIEIEKDMTPVLLEDLGLRVYNELKKERRSYGLYQCQYCGKEFEHLQKTVKSGNTKSCGCLAERGNNTRHGLHNHPLYNTWRGIQYRCYNPKNKKYKDYGGRGIKVCDRWMDINNFIEDMYPTWEEGLSIDRVDVNGDYEIANCRWTTDEIQNRNTRDICKSNTSGFRGVNWSKVKNKWRVQIMVDNKLIHLGYHQAALEAAKAYETYVRLNNLEHNFTPALTPEEVEALYEKES